jgi:hypothetical protein
MLRLFLDDHGSGAHDLFVKIDGRPSWVWVTDTSWLYDFFSRSNQPLSNDEEPVRANRTAIASLIHLWQDLLLADESTCYLPYDLSDQYVGAFRVTKGKKLYSIVPVWSPDLTGGLTSNFFLQVQTSTIWKKGTEPEWHLAPASILTGLTWSLRQLEQPVTPLHYQGE